MSEAATPMAIDQLGKVFGPSIGFYVVKCRNGGFLALVNGVVHSAHTSLHEAWATMGNVAASEYGETAVPPERAHDVTPRSDLRNEPIPGGGPRVVRPPHVLSPHVRSPDIAERARTTAVVLLALLTVGVRGIVGV